MHTRILITCCLLAISPSLLHAHPMQLTQARLQIHTQQHTYDLLIDCDVTSFVMGSVTGHFDEDIARQMASLTDDELLMQVTRVRQWFASQMQVTVDRIAHEPTSIEFPDLATLRETEIGRDGEIESIRSTIRVKGRLPDGARAMVLRLPGEIGGLLLTAKRDEVDLSPQLLAAGQPCQALALSDEPLNAAEKNAENQQDSTATSSIDQIPPGVITAGQFLALGFWHIIPQGLDHILFVLGLFLLSPTLKPILWQVTAFTVAHSLTLALSMYGIMRLPSHVVEPLIAASIAFIAIENIFTSKLHPWRPIIVFAFGLLHGLGFAGVMADLPLPAGQIAPAIIGFNLGVEVGQLGVIGLAFLCVGWMRNKKCYRPAITIPGSIAIAVVGIVWTIQRTLGG